jgi:hypothetical protein
MRGASVGIGLRPVHYREVIDTLPEVDFLELISENFMVAGGNARRVLRAAADRYLLALHGVAMNLGSVDPLDPYYLEQLGKLVDETRPAIVSDHLSWGGFAGARAHDLWPLPYTAESLAHVAARVSAVQDFLGRPLALENPSTYLAFAHSTMSEPEFLAALVERTGCELLLDVNNVYVSAHNLGLDARAYLDALPTAAVRQMHLAGFTALDTHLLDTHDHPVADPVWDLYRDAILRFGPTPTLIEWDADIPPLARLVAEADRARAIMLDACVELAA